MSSFESFKKWMCLFSKNMLFVMLCIRKEASNLCSDLRGEFFRPEKEFWQQFRDIYLN